MTLFNLEDKLIIDDKKYLVLLDELKELGYETISFETYVMKFVDELFDVVCIGNNICKNRYGTSCRNLNQFQFSELINVINKQFGRHCFETSIIAKYINKKIVIYDIYYEDIKKYFVKYNFKILEL